MEINKQNNNSLSEFSSALSSESLSLFSFHSSCHILLHIHSFTFSQSVAPVENNPFKMDSYPRHWAFFSFFFFLYHRMFIVVVMVVHGAASQHRVIDGRCRSVGSLCCRPIHILLPLAAQDLPEGCAHLLVTVGVDDGIHGRVELGE